MKKIGIIRGGMSDEYDISLKTGGRVIAALRNAGLEPVDMLVTKDGVFHVNGKETDIERIPEFADGVFIALHGKHRPHTQQKNYSRNSSRAWYCYAGSVCYSGRRSSS